MLDSWLSVYQRLRENLADQDSSARSICRLRFLLFTLNFPAADQKTLQTGALNYSIFKMRFLPCLGLLLGGFSGVLGSTTTPAVLKPTTVVERDLFSTASSACPTVSLAAPQRMCFLLLKT